MFIRFNKEETFEQLSQRTSNIARAEIIIFLNGVNDTSGLKVGQKVKIIKEEPYE